MKNILLKYLLSVAMANFFVIAASLAQNKSLVTKADSHTLTKDQQKLADELIKMEAADIAAIEEARKTKTGTDAKAAELASKQLVEIRRRNTERLKEIINQIGWPGESSVGEKASYAAHTIIQHSDHDRAFQEKCLPLLKEAGSKGEIKLWEIAYLTDRILVGSGRKQLYGTQFDPCEHTPGDPDSPCAIEDPDNLEQRRKEMGLRPMSVYLKLMKEVRAKGRGNPPKD